MKQFLLGLLLLAGCAAIQPPQPRPVEVLSPIEVTAQPEVSKPVETVLLTKPVQPVIPSVEVSVPVAKSTRYVLESPLAYAKYIPRVEKFFQLALTDSSVLSKSQFDFSTATPASIRESISKGFDISIRTYRPSMWKGGKWSKVIGYHSNGVIYLNSYFVTRPDCEIINTIAHESMHYFGYSHGDNSPVGKDNSVPYWVGDKAEEMCKEGKI